MMAQLVQSRVKLKVTVIGIIMWGLGMQAIKNSSIFTNKD